ncbi:hypothetical protein KUTeg_008601 [Tegillarca granosa]|uniref:INO80 complex subunit F domain-containing protein n=1 Tax=Tegillarca granosa TaxID=220873 RepID=A0ABQ9FEF7_TEGGR|nr:hypothetical protein KUTeg_008601 [Tegillarca granosa]
MAEGLEAQLEILGQETAFLKKYFSLRKKCEQLQQANEKIVNRIQHVQKLIKRYKREKRFLANRLDEYGDPFRDTQVPVMWEEDQLYNMLKPPPPYVPPTSETNREGLSKPKLSQDKSPAASLLQSINPLLFAHGFGETNLQSGSGKGKQKAKPDKDKDPNAPKKPANAFLLFCQQQRTSVQEEYYKVFYDMYELEKERYDKEMREYHDREDVSMKETITSQAEVNAAAMGLEAQNAVDALMLEN